MKVFRATSFLLECTLTVFLELSINSTTGMKNYIAGAEGVLTGTSTKERIGRILEESIMLGRKGEEFESLRLLGIVLHALEGTLLFVLFLRLPNCHYLQDRITNTVRFHGSFKLPGTCNYYDNRRARVRLCRRRSFYRETC